MKINTLRIISAIICPRGIDLVKTRGTDWVVTKRIGIAFAIADVGPLKFTRIFFSVKKEGKQTVPQNVPYLSNSSY